ncbi:hypothetical protein HYX14_00755 [Candidatus Woesearchaeota archaeon]|nr:hypothetical protein [Candidatus Woesearchaeota archaeon]
MHEKLLTDAGLTQNEARVYMALLQTGKAQSGKIVQKAVISGGKVYETLYKLMDKGLVEVVVENGVKQFHASDPKSLLIYMDEQKSKLMEQTKKLQNIVPELQKMKEFQEPPENVYLIKGFRGIKPIVYNIMQEAQSDAKIMGVRSSKSRKFNIFWQHWHKERIVLKKNARMLFTDRDTEYWNFFKDLKFTEIRSTPSLSPSAIMIIDDHSFIFSYDQEFTCIHIRSPAIAKSFSSFFEGLWNIGKP